MPQIWLTYDELAALMDCDRASARAAAVAVRLDRRKSRDGQTRAKLTPSLTDAFLERMLRQRLDQEIATCAGDLQVLREHMTAHPAAPPMVWAAATDRHDSVAARRPAI